MSANRDVDLYIRRLSRILRRMILRSREFEELCLLLEKEQFEMRLFLVPILFRPGKKGALHKKGQKLKPLQFELTQEDRFFLKKAGIRF